MTRHTAKKNIPSGPLGVLRACTLSLPISLAAAMILLILSAAIAYAQPDPATLARPLSMVSLYASALLCGMISAKKSEKPLLSGVIGGIGMVLILFLLSLIPLGSGPSAISPFPAILMHLGVIASSALGACIAMKKPKKHAMRRGKKRRR